MNSYPSDSSSLWTLFLSRNHISASSVHQVPVQSSLDPLANGQVDGIITYSTEVAPLNAQGLTPVFLWMADYRYNDINNGYGASVSSIENNSDAIVRFMRAEIRGWQDFVKDPEYGAHLTVKKGYGAGVSLKENTDECVQTAALMTYGSVYHDKGLFWLSSAIEDAVLENVNPTLEKKLTAAEIFDSTIMPRVFHGKKTIA